MISTAPSGSAAQGCWFFQFSLMIRSAYWRYIPSEMIAQAGFGHTFNALEPQGEGDEYVRALKDVV